MKEEVCKRYPVPCRYERMTFFCYCIAGWRIATSSTGHLGPPGAVEQHPDPRWLAGSAPFRNFADSWPVVAWSSEQRTPSLCVCYSFGRSCYARCFFLFSRSLGTCCHGCFCHHCAVTRPGLDPHTTLKSSSSSAQSAYSTAHCFPFVFNYRVVVGVLPSSSWCC